MTQSERREMWRQRVEACRSSGQSVAAWCREHHVSEQQMRYWLKRFPLKPVAPVSPAWIPVLWDDRSVDGGVTIRAGKVMIEVRPGFDRELLADVVEALTVRC